MNLVWQALELKSAVDREWRKVANEEGTYSTRAIRLACIARRLNARWSRRSWVGVYGHNPAHYRLPTYRIRRDGSVIPTREY